LPSSSSKPFLFAIACGGTGGHFYPGLAVADVLVGRDCDVLLLVSAKEVDQQAVQSITNMTVATLPAVGLTRGQVAAFCRGFWNSFRLCRRLFRPRPPQAVLSMGGFTGGPPLLAGKTVGAVTFLHESNAMPGRANRWLAYCVDRAFVGFYAAAPRLPHQHVITTGTPVRTQLQPGEPQGCRSALGLHPDHPVLLIQGGSQGAHGINEQISQAVPVLAERAPELQYLHLTGSADAVAVKAAYERHQRKAAVFPFLTEMELALGAATIAVSRAGASSLAELATMRLPAVLVPYPHAADNHQYWNARTFADQGAAWLLQEKDTSPQILAGLIVKLLQDTAARAAMQQALAKCHTPLAAELIADKMMALLPEPAHGLTNRARQNRMSRLLPPAESWNRTAEPPRKPGVAES
jgi:UDP-N-acetylglucosamine--N-acetylmuramyl-(pentapeptide) pyrophosphoryl-undecaprenol N-acetylglucosamine transferase